MRIINSKIVDPAGANNMAASITGAPQALDHMAGFSAQANWTGTAPVGAFKLQASLDGANWADIIGSAAAISGNTGSVVFNFPDVYYPWIRPVYTRTSGTGQLTVYTNLKGF